MAATATSSNIKAKGKVMWSGGDSGGRAGHTAPAPFSSHHGPLPSDPLTCAWRVKRHLVLGRGDTGHVGPFHMSQAIIVPKSTMEVFIHSQGGQPGHRQGNLRHMRGNGAMELGAGAEAIGRQPEVPPTHRQ